MSQSHGATLTIDLAALRANWRLLAARAGAAECGAVIKADAYGTGIEVAAPALWEAGCRTFFVAHLSEAIRARAALPEAAIFVLNGLPPDSATLYIRHRLMPVIATGDEAADWLRVGNGQPCALHVDTGMNRLGFSVAEITAAAPGMIAAGLGVSLVMSHFTASEDPSDPATRLQARLFATAVKPLFAGTAVRFSLLNSAGHFLDDVDAHDLTRPGYALYGGNPQPGKANPMRPVVRLEAPIIQLRTVEAGERVGYNGRWTAKGPRRLATISLGYADGYCRNASGTDERPGGEALVGGVLCPIAGTVSMDLVILDVTDAPAEVCSRGKMVTLIGDSLEVDRVGMRAGTIGYEILTGLGRRYRRQVVGG